jgi:hypothetical protein
MTSESGKSAADEVGSVADPEATGGESDTSAED